MRRLAGKSALCDKNLKSLAMAKHAAGKILKIFSENMQQKGRFKRLYSERHFS